MRPVVSIGPTLSISVWKRDKTTEGIEVSPHGTTSYTPATNTPEGNRMEMTLVVDG